MRLERFKLLFQDTLKYIFENDQMKYSQRLAVISLIFKKATKPALKITDQLVLTNADYEIRAFILTRRLKKVIDIMMKEN